MNKIRVIRGNLNHPKLRHLKKAGFKQLIKHKNSVQPIRARKINRINRTFEYVPYPIQKVLSRMLNDKEHLYQIVEGYYPCQHELQLNYEPTILKQLNWFADQEDTQALVICSGDVFTKLHYDAGSASFQFIVEGQKHYIYVHCVFTKSVDYDFHWDDQHVYLQRDINLYNTEMTTRRSQLNMPGIF